jgi:hypothetical protein
MSRTVTAVRVLVYTGPEEWVAECKERAFVALHKELGDGKSIESFWGQSFDITHGGSDGPVRVVSKTA